MATETIENTVKYNEKKLTEEEIKHDCGRKAFVMVCIVADRLYVSEKVLKICKANRWDYIIRYKEECAPLIRREYEPIPEKQSRESGVCQ